MPIDSGNLALKGLDDLFSTEENRQDWVFYFEKN